MTSRRPAPLALVLLVTLGTVASAGTARAQEVALVASSVEASEVVALLRRSDTVESLERALALTADGRSALDASEEPSVRRRRLALVHAVVRAGHATLRPGVEAEVRLLLQRAGARAVPDDLALLRSLEAASTRVSLYARSLARRAVARIDASLDPRTLLGFLRGSDDEARRRALGAISERLQRARAKVDAGGELDGAEQAELADRDLVDALVDALAWRSEATDLLAPDLTATACPSALAALALVEAPAMPALERALRSGTVGAEAALEAVRKASLERLRRHPRSSWSSARGSIPLVVPGAVPCPACQRPLPSGARFCPSCAAVAPGVACPRCGHVGASEVCSRCGGRATGEGLACRRCSEALGAKDRFCRRCGVARDGVPAETPANGPGPR